MIVAEDMYRLGSQRSVIRDLFEYGKKLANPTVPAPDCVNETIRSLTQTLDGMTLHGYTSAQGDEETRQAVADYLNRTHGTRFKADDFYMAMGAAAALSLCFRALTVDSSDEFITIAPFFPEYRVFVEAAGAKLVVVPADTKNFQIDFEELEKRISRHTKGIIINSPNNPSGAVYSEETIKRLAALLEKKEQEFGTVIFLLADEPYREIVYDGAKVPFITKYYKNTLVCYSFSKSLSLPGERIGYVLVPEEVAEHKAVYAAIAGAGRSLGYVCAPSLFQKVLVSCIGQTGDVKEYQKNRDLLYVGLTNIGYECFKPQGAFYLFVKSPSEDSEAFCELAKEEHLLLVPADGFGCPGYVRISYCVDTEMIKRALPAFERLFARCRVTLPIF